MPKPQRPVLRSIAGRSRLVVPRSHRAMQRLSPLPCDCSALRCKSESPCRSSARSCQQREKPMPSPLPTPVLPGDRPQPQRKPGSPHGSSECSQPHRATQAISPLRCAVLCSHENGSRTVSLRNIHAWAEQDMRPHCLGPLVQFHSPLGGTPSAPTKPKTRCSGPAHPSTARRGQASSPGQDAHCAHSRRSRRTPSASMPWPPLTTSPTSNTAAFPQLPVLPRLGQITDSSTSEAILEFTLSRGGG
jgi:hypothetical protein